MDDLDQIGKPLEAWTKEGKGREASHVAAPGRPGYFRLSLTDGMVKREYTVVPEGVPEALRMMAAEVKAAGGKARPAVTPPPVAEEFPPLPMPAKPTPPKPVTPAHEKEPHADVEPGERPRGRGPAQHDHA